MMTTSEMVVRIAAFFGGWPEHVWAWPVHYYRKIQREYLKIVGATPRPDGSQRRTGGHPNITIETISGPR